jgi:hypothetical protein
MHAHTDDRRRGQRVRTLTCVTRCTTCMRLRPSVPLTGRMRRSTITQRVHSGTRLDSPRHPSTHDETCMDRVASLTSSCARGVDGCVGLVDSRFGSDAISTSHQTVRDESGWSVRQKTWCAHASSDRADNGGCGWRMTRYNYRRGLRPRTHFVRSRGQLVFALAERSAWIRIQNRLNCFVSDSVDKSMVLVYHRVSGKVPFVGAAVVCRPPRLTDDPARGMLAAVWFACCCCVLASCADDGDGRPDVDSVR